MDSYEENQIEDGFDQIEDKQKSVRRAEKLKGSLADEGTVGNPASTIRICDFCGKTFNNGKALGGHRRHHLQAQRKEATAAQSRKKVKIRLPNLKNYKNSSSFNYVDEDNNFFKVEVLMSNRGKTTCDLCNKDFPSMKSYYGHMRTHPEKDRRGLRSPNPDDDSKGQKETSFVTNSTVIAPHDGSPVNLSKSLPSLSKTNSRDMESIGDAEAAQNLVYLSCREYFSTPKSLILGMSPKVLTQTMSSDDAIKAKSSTSGIALQCKEEKVDDYPSREQKVVRKRKFHRRGSLIGGKDEEKEEDGANWGEEECEKDMKDDDSHLEESTMMKKEKKISKLMSSQSSKSEENPLIKTLKMQHREYKCIICGKSFATFQALGGHTSSHNKRKNIIIRTMNEPGDNNGAGFIPQVINETNGSEPKGLVVEEANTAQDLGDHQRRFSSRRSSAETPLSEEAASSVGTSLSLQSSHQEVRGASPLAVRALDFDLNEPYVMDEQSN
ncbi:hypothetical protein L6164_029205 [Bauhinia variegata]|uniref:Uncharacterized protein n=1 Tax=Bauhinia variegata TaxID=167791 RepID=A0ACB9L8K7_BAUVA|nr:hypothetical protein L6164_029205 [Bauhinia variegata]